MKATWSGLIVLVLLGCGDVNDAKQSERKPVSPPGIAQTILFPPPETSLFGSPP